jgi:hypothetical protein
MNKEIMRNAMIDYARGQYGARRDPYSAEQWATVMNCYARRENTQTCAVKAGMRPYEAALLYCRFSIALAETALSRSREAL